MLLRIKNRFSLCGFGWEENSVKERRQWKKYPWAKNGICVFVCDREKRKINSFQITVIIFKVNKKYKSSIKKDFKSTELLTKLSFFLYFRDRSKNGEGNKDSARVTDHPSKKLVKAENNVNLLYIIDCGLFNRIFYGMFYYRLYGYQCCHWFYDFPTSCSTCLKSTKSKKSDGGYQYGMS